MFVLALCWQTIALVETKKELQCNHIVGFTRDFLKTSWTCAWSTIINCCDIHSPLEILSWLWIHIFKNLCFGGRIGAEVTSACRPLWKYFLPACDCDTQEDILAILIMAVNALQELLRRLLRYAGIECVCCTLKKCWPLDYDLGWKATYFDATLFLPASQGISIWFQHLRASAGFVKNATNFALYSSILVLCQIGLQIRSVNLWKENLVNERNASDWFSSVHEKNDDQSCSCFHAGYICLTCWYIFESRFTAQWWTLLSW